MRFNLFNLGLVLIIKALERAGSGEKTDEELAEGLAAALKEKDPAQEKQFASVLYGRFFRQAYKLGRYYGLSHHDAEDVSQDAFIKLCRVGSGYKNGMRFKPWFFKIVLNKIRDKHSESKRTRTEEPDFFSVLPEDKEHFSKKIQNRSAVDSIIGRLPVKLKDTVSLRIVADMDFEEIAGVMGMSSRQVRNRLEQAYGLIREMGVVHELG